MPINIKNREAERLLNTLSRKLRVGKTSIVLELLRRESARQSRIADVESRRRQIAAISRRAAKKIRHGDETPEEIIGYDERGLPT